METTNALELTERLTNAGFTVERFTREDGFTEEADRNAHFDIRKDTNPTLECHVEIDAEGTIVEAFIEILDENGKSYTNRDMTMFIEDADCENIDSLCKRLEHVFS
jgi:hypothetical protein